jgi:hypothetical protein
MLPFYRMSLPPVKSDGLLVLTSGKEPLPKPAT